MTNAWVGLGANLGDREATLHAAVRELGRVPGVRLSAVSGLYESPAEAVPGLLDSAPPFLNAVVGLRTALAPRALLWHLLRIEARLGRHRQERTLGRTLDLDLLAVGDAVLHEADLELPHPRLATRTFVVRPLLELAPDFRLPGGGLLLADLSAAAAGGCRPYDPAAGGVDRAGRPLPPWPPDAR